MEPWTGSAIDLITLCIRGLICIASTRGPVMSQQPPVRQQEKKGLPRLPTEINPTPIANAALAWWLASVTDKKAGEAADWVARQPVAIPGCLCDLRAPFWPLLPQPLHHTFHCHHPPELPSLPPSLSRTSRASFRPGPAHPFLCCPNGSREPKMEVGKQGLACSSRLSCRPERKKNHRDSIPARSHLSSSSSPSGSIAEENYPAFAPRHSRRALQYLRCLTRPPGGPQITRRLGGGGDCWR